MATYDPRYHEVHVLLVDGDPITLVEAAKLLQANSYRVTAIQDAPLALSMLSKGKTTFDLLMVDMASSNRQGYELLYEAANMEVTVILMSGDVNPVLAKCAIEDGAFLFIEKPATPDLLRYLWQYTYREKLRKYKEECFRPEQFITANKINCEAAGTSLGQDIVKEDISTRKKKKRRAPGITIQDTDRSNANNNCYNNRTKRSRMCTSWTLALHRRFVAAIKELGEGRCYPREIVRLMNVPGLTTVQVSSHLQRCRLGWRHPEERDAPPLEIPKPYTFKLKAHGLLSSIEGSSQPFIRNEMCENVAHENNVQNTNEAAPTPGVLNMEQDAFGAEPVGYNFPNMNDSTHMPGFLDMGPDGVVPQNNNLEENFPENMAGADADQWLPFPEFSPDFVNEVLTDNFNVQDLHVNQALPEKAISTESEETENDWSAWIASLLNDEQ